MFAVDVGAFGDSIAVISAGSTSTGFFQHLQLQASTVKPLTARVGLETLSSGGVNNPHIGSAPAGGTVSMIVVFQDTIPAPLAPNDLAFDLSYDRDVLTPVSILPSNGWNLTDSSSLVSKLSSGVLHLHFTRVSSGEIPVGTPIATVNFQLSIADSLESAVTVGSVMFDPADSLYTQCTLQAVYGSGVEILLVNSCGDSLFSGALRGAPLIHDLMVYPNPAGEMNSAQSAVVKFQLEADASLMVEIADALGNTFSIPEYNLKKGAQMISLDVKALPVGSYFVSVRDSQGERSTTKFMIKR
jgi:hypothetical protein